MRRLAARVGFVLTEQRLKELGEKNGVDVRERDALVLTAKGFAKRAGMNPDKANDRLWNAYYGKVNV